MWKIHGKIYDLNLFLDKHPGGKQILEISMGEDDLTASFESYHAFSDMEKIKKIMKKYEIGNCEPPKVTFKPNGFYRTLQKRVIKELKNNTKSDWKWFLKTIIQSIIFFYCFYFSFYNTAVNTIYRTITAIIAAHMWVQLGFCVMHDASHMAISKNKNINENLSSIWNSFGLWDSQLWSKHHVIRHHAFTGDMNLDPDTIHFKPFIRKSIKIPNKSYYKITKYFSKTLPIFTICIFPGMYVGQGIISYHLSWMTKSYLWKMELPNKFIIYLGESLLKLFTLYSLINSNWFILLAFIITLNTSYAICILPDHDTMETQQNHIENIDGKDWGELQVRHSGNFCTQKPWVYQLFGGINYQIEHHLFPSVCHIHFPRIKPIVKKTCKEFKIPYVHHNSFKDAVSSTLQQYSNVAKEL